MQWEVEWWVVLVVVEVVEGGVVRLREGNDWIERRYWRNGTMDHWWMLVVLLVAVEVVVVVVVVLVAEVFLPRYALALRQDFYHLFHPYFLIFLVLLLLSSTSFG